MGKGRSPQHAGLGGRTHRGPSGVLPGGRDRCAPARTRSVRRGDPRSARGQRHLPAGARAARELDVQPEIGLTAGAWIVPDLAERIAMIREWEGVDCATVNLSEPGFEKVMTAMLDVGIGIDVGLWAPVEMDRLVRSGLLPRVQRVSIELDPGEPYF